MGVDKGMKHIMNHFPIILLGVMMYLSGCTDDLGIVGNRQVDYLCFTATLGGDSLSHSSRGTSDYLSYEEEDWSLVDDADISNESRGNAVSRLEGSAGIIGYIKGTSWTLWDRLDHQRFEFAGDELSTTGDPIYWNAIKTTDNLLVHAYAPNSIKSNVDNEQDNFDESSHSFTYTVPAVVSDQTDILVARTEVPSNYRSSIPLAFEHALTAVKFNIGFNCTVKSLKIEGLKNSGTYTFGEGWSEQSGNAAYEFTFGGESDTNISLGAGERFKVLTDGENTLMMIPQELNGAKVTLTYDDNKTIVSTLKDKEWKSGKMVTYTIYKERPNIVYLDLAAGNVGIDGKTKRYSGAYFQTKDGTTSRIEITDGTHTNDVVYYVYQSTESNRNTTGLVDGSWVIPSYPRVECGGKPWSEYITNNACVEDVIEMWDDGAHVKGSAATNEKHIGVSVVRDAGRSHTSNKINVIGQAGFICNLTIDNVYSVYQQSGDPGYRTEGTLTFKPTQANSKMYLNLVGDNRLGNIHYCNFTRDNGSAIVFEGTGSLTVADANFVTGKYNRYSVTGYYSNHHSSAIGGSDDESNDKSYGIIFKSGVIFAGSTQAENCSAIGAGGNEVGEIIIDGGVVTAVASTTGTAIGGGIGFSAEGGVGYVTINGGNVYAYNLQNPVDIPSAAIGGAGSSDSKGSDGYVTITGGNVFALSALGTAIGGGSSKTKRGGDAYVTISGGTVIAKSISVLGGPDGGNSGVKLLAGAGIGGGTGGTNGGVNGGTANVTISGNPIIRTGSIGGGKTNNSTGTIGSANINVSGGDIQAQFVMAAGSGISPTFTMTGGTVRNSDTSDEEYYHIQPHGGAVYLEEGTFEMSGGEIVNCSAIRGGAVYIKGNASTTFTMSDGKIYDCTSIKNPLYPDIDPHGGAVYLEGGEVSLSDGSIFDNLANGGHGGGIYITDGNFEMTGTATALLGNSAIYRDGKGGHGGALYVTSSNNAQVSVLSGTISENSSDRLGGGICVDMGNSDKTAEVTIGTASNTLPSIISNHTILSGGGLFVRGSKANVTIKGGKIAENTTSAYVVNENVANELGMVSLLDEQVTTHVTVTFNGNGGTLEEGSIIQHIVTATNSLLVTPTFTRAGYKFIGWNTRADGYGDGDYNDGKVMNIQTDLTLYAQWELN